jgi:hypothetical protein
VKFKTTFPGTISTCDLPSEHFLRPAEVMERIYLGVLGFALTVAPESFAHCTTRSAFDGAPEHEVKQAATKKQIKKENGDSKYIISL